MSRISEREEEHVIEVPKEPIYDPDAVPDVPEIVPQEPVKEPERV